MSGTGREPTATFTFEEVIIPIFECDNLTDIRAKFVGKKSDAIFLSLGSLEMDRETLQVKILHSQMDYFTHAESRTIGKSEQESVFFIVYDREYLFYLLSRKYTRKFIRRFGEFDVEHAPVLTFPI